MLLFVREIFDFCFIIEIARIAQTNGRCGLKIPVDVPRNEPVYLVQHQHNISLFKPSGETNTFSSSGNLLAFCPGKKNSIQIEQHPIDSNLTEITCGNANFLVNGFGDVGNLNKINCTKGVQADISVKKKQKCSTTGYIIDVGFKLTNTMFLPTFTICFDNSNWTPIWSKHVINGKSIKCNCLRLVLQQLNDCKTVM